MSYAKHKVKDNFSAKEFVTYADVSELQEAAAMFRSGEWRYAGRDITPENIADLLEYIAMLKEKGQK